MTENKEIVIVPKVTQSKEAANGMMLLVEGADGTKYSCFDHNVEKLQNCIGKQCKVVVKQTPPNEQGRVYNNIVEVLEVSDEKMAEPKAEDNNVTGMSMAQHPKAQQFRSPAQMVACELIKLVSDVDMTPHDVVKAYKAVLKELE